ncbi:hypothetical protein NGM10_14780 [Halorussus salilacus]|uniref:DUF7344 domain-containing protein n=1 Tax=Halorussus salilacus TaxID=2953750 RepID=UPI0020A06F50|nr:hypothetical protein [Halorussus salilacus]USZ67986.1 hypothetical protein NGM10_14780 [Halorussus salilacus]
MSERDGRRSLTTDEAIDLLAHDERRRALAALRAQGGSAALDHLAGATVARAQDCSPDDVAAAARERAAAALHHQHLPRLVDAEVVEYDREENRAELTAVAGDLDPFLSMLSGNG